jgi:GT2 family glycosyltransferase
MRQAGYRVGYYPGARIIHLGGASAARAVTRMRRQEARSRWLLIAKHYGPITKGVYRVKAGVAIVFWGAIAWLRGHRLTWID